MNGNFVLEHREYNPADLEKLSSRLDMRNAYKSEYEANWILTGDILAAFDGKEFYLLDLDFVPILEWESDSFIMACGISDSCKYAACLTAHNSPEFAAEDAVFVLFDVDQRCAVTAKRNLGIGINGIQKIAIDEEKQEIVISISVDHNADPIDVKYDFDLVPVEKSLDDFIEAPGHSPYVYNDRARSLIEKMTENYTKSTDEKVLRLLSMIDDADKKISPYQLSLTYKNLGDMYAGHSLNEKALKAYSKGLALNAKLPVKKKIKDLTVKIKDT